MLRLYLVRHGQTDSSLENRFCGSIDPPLNAPGRAMADALAARYASEPWAAIYASPLERARQTAAPLAERTGTAVRIEPGLAEIAYGEWEGRREDDVEREDRERFAAFHAHPAKVAPPGGETARAVADRALLAYDTICARHPDGQVLVVSHKATLRVLLCALLGIDIDLYRARLAQPTAAVSILSLHSTGPLLERLGDVSHLPPGLLAGT